MRNRFRWGLAAWALLGAVALAQAQAPSSYPDRPIRLVVAFPPGGATDTLARQVTQELGEALGQSVVIENKPGAGGYIAWNYVAAADPDGYTLLMAENALGISQALYKKTSSSFDPVKQYDAIAVVATSPLVLAVANNVKANSVNELIAYARAMPQKINYASAGIGSVSHLTFEVIKAGTGTRRPMARENVTVHYSGWTTDGVLFDSSVLKGTPVMLDLNNVIRGWTEGLQLMVEGERTRFWVPEKLAYKGERGKPRGMLVFDVDLIRIEPPIRSRF